MLSHLSQANKRSNAWAVTHMRRRSASGRDSGKTQLILATKIAVLPFVLGLVLILALYGRPQQLSGASSTPSRVLTAQPAPGLASSCNLTAQPAPPCNCTQQGAQSQQLSALAGSLAQETVDKVLGAANSSDPAEQTVRVTGEPLPSLFLFVGILSGRGYRHRRLAVRWGSCPAHLPAAELARQTLDTCVSRESWANLATQSGDAACRFILSQDEVTPQVRPAAEQDCRRAAHQQPHAVKTTQRSVLRPLGATGHCTSPVSQHCTRAGADTSERHKRERCP